MFVAIWSTLVLLGIGYLSFRRFVLQPETLGSKLSPTSGLVAIFIVVLMITYLVGWWDLEITNFAWQTNWWIHSLSLTALFVVVPNSKHLHLVLAPFAVFLKPELPNTMRPLDLANEDMGLIEFSQLPWKDVLDLNVCVECGRCTYDVCPAHASGGSLSPKHIILNMQHGLLSGGTLIAGTSEEVVSGKAWIDENDLFQCTSCMACEEVCPVGIEHVGRKILDLRRGLVNEGRLNNDKANALFVTMEREPHNPWGVSQEVRRKLIAGEEFPIFDGTQEILLWLGCGVTYDPNGQKTAKAMAKVLNMTGQSWT